MIHLLLAIIYLSFISLGLPDSLLGSAWPSIYPGLNVPMSWAGIISMIITGCTILSSLFSDRLVRKLGTGPLTAVSVAITAGALFGFSISHSFLALCLWAVPYGLGAGSVDAALNNFVALHYKAAHMNWLHCFWGIGATLGPSIMGLCLTRGYGWHTGYRTISLLQIVLTGLLFISLPLWKQKSGTTGSESSFPVPLTLKQMISLSGAKQILVAFFCYCALEQTTGLWGSSYMVVAKGISTERAASLAALFYLGITAGRFASGFLVMLLPTSQTIRLGQFLAASGAILLLISHDQASLCAGFLLAGAGCAPIYPGLLHQTPERFGHQASQSMMGLQMAAAYLGSTLAPPLAGMITDHINIHFYPLFQLFFIIVLVIMVETCKPSKKRPF